ncbi:MAG: Sir2 family NAD-dependent protein deacetylase [Geobacteraceae bacterium]|nr:Sir2 family NAD-dependent protein deacetylase [Geobacteraceae bacterium]
MKRSKVYLEAGECAEMIKNAGSVVALTGAGISTAAGIPDFRGPQGLYATRRYDPELVFNIGHFRRDPLDFYRFTRDFMAMTKNIRPTFAHRALAAFEERGLLDGVITQNIDALHHVAGSRRIIELHGSYWSASCTGCAKGGFSGATSEWWDEAVRTGPNAPIVCCPACGSVIKPDVVFFGEAVKGFEQAAALVAGSDLLLVLGSSLTVYPAAMLPKMASGAVVVINQGTVGLSEARNRCFLDAELNGFLRRVAVELGVNVA